MAAIEIEIVGRSCALGRASELAVLGEVLRLLNATA